MMGKCEICGKECSYFTDTYDPKLKKRYVIPLCEEHQQIVSVLIVKYVEHITGRDL